MEVKELTCDEVKEYYEGFLNKTLPESEMKTAAKHFAACMDCYHDFLSRGTDIALGNKGAMN